jgi:predicted acylesterase/phospholipase RssA
MVEIKTGNIIEATTASMSLASIFRPVNIASLDTPTQKSCLVDGCYTSNLPIDVIKKYARYIIAVNVGIEVKQILS